MYNIVFIVGPTATGKSELAFNIAKKVKAEIVSCDSMLVYKEPRIITSKPPYTMLKEVKHYFIDIISVKDTYDVFRYYTEAKRIIIDLYSQGRKVIVCGGSGLYMKVLLDGIFKGSSRDDELRKNLEKEAKEKGNMSIYNRLKEVDPSAAEKISPNDTKRVIRALEVYYTVGRPISEKQKEREGLWNRYPIKVFGLAIERKKLYERINLRVEKMFEEGIVEEVQRLLELPLSITAQKIIGINEIKGYLEGKYSLSEAKSLIAKNTCNFAKRQFTWFKKDKRIQWIDAEKKLVDKDKIILKNF